MGIVFTGAARQRYVIPSGGISLDLALKGGIPCPAIIEIYGFTHVGKSTLGYYLMGRSRPAGKVGLADFEHYDEDYLARCLVTAGFSGEVHRLDVSSGETAVTEIRNCLRNPDYQAAMLDSVGSLVLEQETLEDVTLQEQLGRRAKLMAKCMRLSLHSLQRNPALLIMINHLHPLIGFGKGTTTSGGVAIHNSALVRIRLKQETQNKDYLVVQGKVDKLRQGGSGGFFKFVIIPGRGIHLGLTLVEDALWLGAASKDRIIKVGDRSFGYMKNLVDAALDGNEEIFEDFRGALGNVLGTPDRPGDIEEDSDE